MGKIITPEFRVSYPNVFKPKYNELSKKDEYGLVALFPAGADLSKLKELAKKAAEEKWGTDPKKWPKAMRTPFRDQADREKEDEETGKKWMPDGYEKGAVYFNLKSQRRPAVVDKNVQEIIDEQDFYAGCWARAEVSCYAYSQAGNSGVNFGLNMLQKTKEGDPLGGRAKPEDAFSPITDGSGQADSDSMFN